MALACPAGRVVWHVLMARDHVPRPSPGLRRPHGLQCSWPSGGGSGWWPGRSRTDCVASLPCRAAQLWLQLRGEDLEALQAAYLGLPGLKSSSGGAGPSGQPRQERDHHSFATWAPAWALGQG